MTKIVDISESREIKTPRAKKPKPELVVAPRPKYNGGLSAEELSRPGSKLVAMLVHRAHQLGHTLHDMCGELHCTYGYIHQLRNGSRHTRHISDEFAAACAQYLTLPRLSILLTAGRISAQDFFDAQALSVYELPRAMEFIYGDPDYGYLVPPKMMEADYPTMFLVVTLYEKATGRKLLPEKLNPMTLIAELEALSEIEKRLKEERVASDKAKATTAEAPATAEV